MINLQNKKILFCVKNDLAVYWVHNLTQKKNLLYKNELCDLYHSEYYDFYIYYYNLIDTDSQQIKKTLLELINKNNKVNLIMCDFRCVDNMIEICESDEFTFNNFDYFILNHMGEFIYDNNPRKIRNLKKIKKYFSCSDVLNESHQVSDFQLTSKFYKDYKYSLIYFYFKLGLNFIQTGNHIIINNNPEDLIFLYTKAKPNSHRELLIELALKTNKIKSKEFNEDDYFWFNRNNSLHATSFIIDYNSCKFNLIMETQSLNNEKDTYPKFITEKTLKSLMVSTPSYVTLLEDIYEDLNTYGFYFLNSEFGKYNFENYKRFCDFFKNSDEKTINQLYINSIKKSNQNKIKLEEYIFSDKKTEINLLWN